MKKILAIMMALVMCCSLVVCASAAEYVTDYFDIDIDLDGEWTEEAYDEETFNYTFETSNSGFAITVYDGYDSDELYDEFNDIWVQYNESAQDDPNFSLESGEIDGCPAIFFSDIEDNTFFSTDIYVLTDDYLYEIDIFSDGESDVHSRLCDAIDSMTLNSTCSMDFSFDENVDVEEAPEANEDGSYVYEGQGFKITSKYELDDSEWDIDSNGDGSHMEYYLYSYDYETLEIKVSVETNNKGYKAVQGMYNDSKEDGNAELIKISGADACKIDYNGTDYIYTYYDGHIIVIQCYGYEEEMAIAEEIIEGFEITGKVTPPTKEEMKEAGVAVPEDTTAAAKDADKEDKGGSNVVIIVVVVVAVVAVAAVVVVLVLKKKKA